VGKYVDFGHLQNAIEENNAAMHIDKASIDSFPVDGARKGGSI
jgi:hypothetical protein